MVLDSSLDANKTPYLKGQLRFALHSLDDAGDGLVHAAKADSKWGATWLDFAATNIQIAVQLRQKVQAVVDKFGGPQQIKEVGG